jgi:hypothetical protein
VPFSQVENLIDKDLNRFLYVRAVLLGLLLVIDTKALSVIAAPPSQFLQRVTVVLSGFITTVVDDHVSPEYAYSVSVLLAPDVSFAISTTSQSVLGLVAFPTPTIR